MDFVFQILNFQSIFRVDLSQFCLFLIKLCSHWFNISLILCLYFFHVFSFLFFKFIQKLLLQLHLSFIWNYLNLSQNLFLNSILKLEIIFRLFSLMIHSLLLSFFLDLFFKFCSHFFFHFGSQFNFDLKWKSLS